MDPRNPYAPPTALVDDIAHPRPAAGDDTLIPYGRRRPAGNGVEWIAASWSLFKLRPGLWIGAVVLGYGVLLLASLVPYVNLVTSVCSPLLTAGFVAMAHASHRGELSGLGHLFEGFRRQTGPLILLGVLYICLFGAFTGILVLWDGPFWFQMILGTGDPQALEGRLLMLLLYILVVSAIGLAMVFAPALVLINGVSPVAAVKMSLVGNAKNVLPGLVCAVTFIPLLLVSVIPLGLGLLVTAPMMFITIYTAYRDIFLE